MSDTTAEHLAWEAQQRPRAGAAAILAGLFTLGGAIGSSLVQRGAPHPGFLESLQRAAQPGRVGGQPSLRLPQFQYVDDHAGELLAATGTTALGFLATGIALAFLARATQARRAEFPRAGVYLPYVGGGFMALQTILIGAGTVTAVKGFLDGPRTVDAALDLSSNGVLVAGSLAQLGGVLAFGAAFVLVCLNSMRAGLLTRLMGIVGIVAGLLTVLQLPILPLPFVQVFWLVALGTLFLGHWPGGVPSAWSSGEAVPWPSSQEVRAARRAESERRRGERPRPAPEPEEPEEPVEVPAGHPHPSSKKRKRKRRH